MSVNVCELIENDDFYKNFLKGIESNSLSSLTIAEQIKKLSEGVDTLSKELEYQVKTNYNALLSQASHAGNLDASLTTLSEHIDRIKNCAQILKSRLHEQYNIIEDQTLILSRMQSASYILGFSHIIIKLCKKLKLTKDVYQQAAILYELDVFTECEILSSVELVKEELNFIVECRKRLKRTALTDLSDGLKESDENKVIKSLKIFIHFHEINKCIENLLKTFVNEIQHLLMECFAGIDFVEITKSRQKISIKDTTKNNLKVPGKAPTLTTSHNLRAKIIKSLTWIIQEELYNYYKQVNLLQECIRKVCEQTLCQEENVENKFQEKLETLFKSTFESCPSHIANCIEESLPKVLHAVKTLNNNISTFSKLNVHVFKIFEAGYLTRCGSNLKIIMNNVDLPTKETIDNLLQRSSEELTAVVIDNQFSVSVSAIIIACNNDFWSKVESQIKLGAETKQVIDIPNSSQLQNINIANLIYYHLNSMETLVRKINKEFSRSTAGKSILDSLQRGKNLILTVIQQLIESVSVNVSIILLSMHREPGLTSEKSSVVGTSLYMKELQEFLQRVWTMHILPFEDKNSIERCGQELANRCIELFVNNVAICKPLSSIGRKKLKNDCVYLETALKPLISNISSLGKSYRLLRAMATIIIQTPEELTQQEISIESPIPSYIILFLLFSHAGDELQSPHTAANWSNEKLLQWLEGHTSERERLELISGALQKYKDSIRRKNSTEYDKLFPLLSTYFEKVYKSLAK